VTLVSIVACVAVVWTLFRQRFGSVVGAWAERFAPSAMLTRICALALVPAFAAQLVLLVHQAHVENGPPLSDWLRTLPLPVYDHHSERLGVHQVLSTAGYLLAALQTGLLVVAAVGARNGVLERGVSRGVAAALALAALVTPAMATTDPYEFVAAGMLGWHAYVPPAHAFDGTLYAPIYEHVPLVGVIYGPLWLGLDILVTAWLPTILAKLIALRVLNIALTAAMAMLLRRLMVGRAAEAAWSLNPAVWFYFVVCVHADVEALLATAAALLAARRGRIWIAMVLVSAAALIKAPFLIAAGPAFVPLDSMRKRVAAWVGACALAGGITLIYPGSVLFSGIANHATVWSARAHERGADTYVLMMPVVAAIAFAIVAFRRGSPALAWIFGQMSPLSAPWYLFWGLPYAVETGAPAIVLVSLPFFAAMRESAYFGGPPIPFYFAALAIAVFAFDAYLSLRRRIVPRYIL
jgi:hypothetical protein